MMKQAVFFDLDDTILWDKKSIQLAFDETCRKAQELFQADAAQLETDARQAARSLYASYDTYAFTQMIGINPFEGLWGKFEDEGTDFKKMAAMIRDYQLSVWKEALAAQNIHEPDAASVLVETFIDARRRSPVLFDDALEVVRKLQDQFVLVLLTNGSPQLQQTKLEITPEIAPLFDHVIISGEFGKGKPDVTIFEHALKKSGTSPEQTWMVGDNPKTDILGANRAGIRSVWLNREADQLPEGISTDHEIKSLPELLDLLPMRP